MLEFGKVFENSGAVFNQNRLYVGLNYEIAKNIKFQLGYMNHYQVRASNKVIDSSNVIWTTLILENLFSQFKKV
jgi:hypothetical protein